MSPVTNPIKYDITLKHTATDRSSPGVGASRTFPLSRSDDVGDSFGAAGDGDAWLNGSPLFRGATTPSSSASSDAIAAVRARLEAPRVAGRART